MAKTKLSSGEVSQLEMRRLAAQQVANLIHLPIDQWPGNCYRVSCLAVKAGVFTGVPAYGTYFGKISRKSMFRQGPARHGWIVNGDTVIDLTRWVFECVEPYVYMSSDTKDYDWGSTQLRALARIPIDKLELVNRREKVPTAVIRLLVEVHGQKAPRNDLVDVAILMWMAGEDPFLYGEFAKPFYNWLVNHGHSAWIPVDYRHMVLGFDS